MHFTPHMFSFVEIVVLRGGLDIYSQKHQLIGPVQLLKVQSDMSKFPIGLHDAVISLNAELHHANN